MLKLRIICIAIFLSALFSLGAQSIPEGYYNTIDQKQERTLKTALHRILISHDSLRYNDLWYYFKTTDVRPNSNQVWDMYSNTVRYYSETGNPSGIQREHSLPKSWWAESDYTDDYLAYTDLNHLYPSDGSANQAKSNYILGEVSNASMFDNGVSRVGKNSYSFAGTPTTANAFEPYDEYKGDFARTYFYMITCYENYSSQWRSDGLNMFNKETYPVLKDWARDMLLKWHRNDPISSKEVLRNEYVYRYQRNRNPFIDFPQLVEYIWGDSTAYVFSLPDNLKTGDPVLITPTNLSEVYFGNVQKGSEVAQDIILKGSSLTGDLRVYLYGGQREYFSLSAATVPSIQVNMEGGYDLEIAYNPTEYGEHTTGLVISGGGMTGTVMVTLKGVCSDQTPLIPIHADQPDLYALGSDIVFRSYQSGAMVYIYNIAGQLLYSGRNSGGWESFTAPYPGVYLVRLNGQTKKIVVEK